jgi:hypothetical protein
VNGVFWSLERRNVWDGQDDSPQADDASR